MIKGRGKRWRRGRKERWDEMSKASKRVVYVGVCTGGFLGGGGGCCCLASDSDHKGFRSSGAARQDFRPTRNVRRALARSDPTSVPVGSLG